MVAHVTGEGQARRHGGTRDRGTVATRAAGKAGPSVEAPCRARRPLAWFAVPFCLAHRQRGRIVGERRAWPRGIEGLDMGLLVGATSMHETHRVGPLFSEYGMNVPAQCSFVRGSFHNSTIHRAGDGRCQPLRKKSETCAEAVTKRIRETSEGLRPWSTAVGGMLGRRQVRAGPRQVWRSPDWVEAPLPSEVDRPSRRRGCFWDGARRRGRAPPSSGTPSGGER